MARNSKNKQDVINSGVYTFKKHLQQAEQETFPRPQTQANKRQPLGSANSMNVLRSVLLEQEKSEVFNYAIPTTATPDTQTSNIKLVVTRDEIAREKQRSRANKTVDPRRSDNAFVDRESLFSIMVGGPPKPETLAMVRENHLMDCSITQPVKTNKAGVFEREKTPEGSQDNEINNTCSSDEKIEFFSKRSQR